MYVIDVMDKMQVVVHLGLKRFQQFISLHDGQLLLVNGPMHKISVLIVAKV